jgi:Ran GTPase-activating protein (RanGAP) involved in mRNA processing and transport
MYYHFELAHLHLHGNGIGAEGAVRLALVLGECTALRHLALRHLELSRNNIGDDGARLLGQQA